MIHVLANFRLFQRVTVYFAMAEIKTFAFLDLETTGLPSMEHNKTKITELCCVMVQVEHIRLGVFPRVQNMLNLCFNPNKLISTFASDVTGLSNDLLQDQSIFTLDTVNILNNFLNINRKPICLVAHNGNKFDYPILQAEIKKVGGCLNEDILCMDSLNAFRDIEEPQCEEQQQTRIEAAAACKVPFEFSDGYDIILSQAMDDYEKGTEIQKRNETTPKKQKIGNSFSRTFSNIKRIKYQNSYKLGDIYTRLTSKPVLQAHNAKADVNMLIMCAATLGDSFCDWAQDNSKRFSEIEPMTPGKSISF